MDRTQARIVYWTFASLVTAALIAPFVAANLGGWVIFLPTLPAAPAVAYAWILQRRVYRQYLRDLDSRPDWLP